MKTYEIDESISAAVHATVPVAAVMDEEADGTLLRHERLALAAIARQASYDADTDSLSRGERLDQVRKIAQAALSGGGV